MKLRPWIHALRTAAILLVFFLALFSYTNNAIEYGVKIGIQETIKRVPSCIESDYQS